MSRKDSPLNTAFQHIMRTEVINAMGRRAWFKSGWNSREAEIAELKAELDEKGRALGDAVKAIQSWKAEYEKVNTVRNEQDAEIELLKAELENWKEAARDFCNNEAYYRGELDKVLELFGQKGYVSDDGSVQSEPLRAKAYQLVGDVIEEVERLKDNWLDEQHAHQKLQDKCSELKDENEIYKTGIETLNPEAVLEAEGRYLDEIELLKAKISRYEGAVEVEGNVVSGDTSMDSFNIVGIKVVMPKAPIVIGQRVRVLVMADESMKEEK